MQNVNRLKLEIAFNNILKNKELLKNIPEGPKKTRFIRHLQDYLYNAKPGTYDECVNTLGYAIGFNVIEG